MIRTCENPACGVLLVRRHNERGSRFGKRKHCSLACEAAALTRFCAGPECGALLVPRPGEEPKKFRSRTACNRACASRANGARLRAQAKKPTKSKAPCVACYGLPHRRPSTGCPSCGGVFREEAA